MLSPLAFCMNLFPFTLEERFNNSCDDELVYLGKNLSFTVMVLNPPFSLLSQPSVFSARQSPCRLVPSRFPRECKSKGTCTLFEWYLQVCHQGSREIQHENNCGRQKIKDEKEKRNKNKDQRKKEIYEDRLYKTVLRGDFWLHEEQRFAPKTIPCIAQALSWYWVRNSLYLG